MFKLKLLLFSFLFFFSSSIFGQNILVNGDFENYEQIPTGLAQMDYAVAWEDFIPNTDFLYHPNGTASHTGNGHGKFTAYGNPEMDSEAFGQDISANPLLADSIYYVEFYTKSLNLAHTEITGYPYVPTNPPYINTHPANLSGAVSLFISEQFSPGVWIMHYGYIQPDEDLLYLAFSAPKNTNFEYTRIDDILIESIVSVVVIDTVSICSSDSVVLDVQRENSIYLWEDGSTNSTFTANSEGIYEVEVRSEDTIFFRTIEVFHDILPAVELGADLQFCDGDSFVADATFAAPTTEYLWSDGSTSPSFSITESGVYDVQISLRACTYYDTIAADVVSFPNLDFGADTILCPDDILHLAVASAGADYLWQDGSTNTYLNIEESGEYSVTVSRAGCEAIDAIKVDYVDIPDDILGVDKELCAEESLLLDASFPRATYLWGDNSTESNYLVEEPGIYTVSINVNNCIGEDEIIISEQLLDCIECDFYLANAFSPNFDGINDDLKILSPCDISEYNFSIFDRWGNQVFQSFNPEEAWDGTFKNKPMPEGTYIAYIDFRFTARRDGELYSTDILLIR